MLISSFILYITLSILLILFLLTIIFYLYYLKFIEPGAIYFPSKEEDIEKMISLTQPTPNDFVLDLGSGDGEVLIKFAKKGVKGLGYEIDPVLVFESRARIKKEGLENMVQINLKSLWDADLSQATIVTVYSFPCYMARLQTLLEKQLTKPTLVVSNDYQFPNKEYMKRNDTIYLYQFP